MTNQRPQGLTRADITRLVHNWIGVSGGYLGDFSYASHDRFWLNTCDIAISTPGESGTTRYCFEDTLFSAAPRDQAAVLRALLARFPPPDEPDPAQPKFRSPELGRQIEAWITQLETGVVTVPVALPAASELVRRALDDADTLMGTSGPESAVDRVHTAMHGYLHSLCADAGITLADRPTMNQLFKALRAGHPRLASLGARSEEVARVLGALASILDALNPIRNNASVAHPNEQLVGEAEAVLVINTVRTLLTYFEQRLRVRPAAPPA